jgi:hypothetical protein
MAYYKQYSLPMDVLWSTLQLDIKTLLFVLAVGTANLDLSNFLGFISIFLFLIVLYTCKGFLKKCKNYLGFLKGKVDKTQGFPNKFKNKTSAIILMFFTLILTFIYFRLEFIGYMIATLFLVLLFSFYFLPSLTFATLHCINSIRHGRVY